MRPTRAHISAPALRANLATVRRLVGPKPAIMAVVKANAYGHGLEVTARVLESTGEIAAFGVATEEEGIQLRSVTQLPITVLTLPFEEEIDTFLRYNLEFTVCDADTVRKISARAHALGRFATLHIKVDTGMNRIGMRSGEVRNFLETIRSLPALNIKGVATHFATSDERDQSFARKQTEEFAALVAELRASGFSLPVAHAANSGAIITLPEASFDMVRPGIMLYGYTPSEDVADPGLTPVLSLSSQIGMIKKIDAGEGVSYGLKYRATRTTTIATVSAGYGDGISRMLSGKASALVRGKRYPIVGTICMDQLMIDVGDTTVAVGDEVVFIGKQNAGEIRADEVARTLGTIPYEVCTMITARVPRILDGM